MTSVVTYHHRLQSSIALFEELLVRGSVSSVFRAPDMHRVYGDATNGFNQVIDFKQCQAMGGTPGQPHSDTKINEICNELHITTKTGANKDLEAETGYTANVGAVWGGEVSQCIIRFVGVEA